MRHAPGLRLTPELIHQTDAMSNSNAGVRRNRQPTGHKSVRKELFLGEATQAALDAARKASGNLSISLYLELLFSSLEAERGSLPVLSPTLDGTEVHTKRAA
jgi:hypothetical protein